VPRGIQLTLDQWLAYQDRHDESLKSVACTHSNGDITDAITVVQYQEIIDTFEREKSEASLSITEMFKTSANRKRITLALSVAVFTMLSGNNIVSVLEQDSHG